MVQNNSTDRAVVEYKNLSERFTSTNPDYNKQYCSIYVKRLERMREILEVRIKEKWDEAYPIVKLHKLVEEDYPKVVVIATIFKDQKLKPSVLKKLAESNQLIPQPIVTHFTDASDTLFIEDELQRYQLLGALDKDRLVTGITAAFLGTDQGQGKLFVHEICFAGFPNQVQRPIPEEDIYVVFISGLDLIHAEKCLLPLQFFVNWISGSGGDINNVNVSKISRLIIAGNSVRTIPEIAKLTISMVSRTQESPENIEAVRMLDALLLKIAQFMEVDVLPGEYDPSNHILPQKPMHMCMFPNSGQYKSMNLVSNPYECSVGGSKIIGTAGQPVKDVRRFSEITDAVDIMEECLKWGHIAPTAPDTLGCFPFYDKDPFVLEECPHIMFAGNQEKFDTKLVKGQKGQVVRLIAVPEFATSFTACLLNLRTLGCIPINFLE